jgi:hypothetical protein
VSEDVLAGDATYRSGNLSSQATLGVGLLRQTFDWSEIEKEPGQYDFGVYDEYVAAATAHGMSVLPVLFKPPPFASGASGAAASRGTHPPRQPGSLGVFAAALVRRYGPQGTFWQERPGIPRAPIRTWQIWNEPNLKAYWPAGPNPKGYTKLLKVAAAAIKHQDPRAEIVTAGLPDSRLSKPLPLLAYIKRMYKARAKAAFDTLAINPYVRDHRELLKKLRAVRQLMDRHGDRRAGIWITELGWADAGPRSPFVVGAGRQAANVRRSFELIGRERRKLRLRGVIYYSWRDASPYPPLYQDFWGLHTGLLRQDGGPKPAFYAFKSALARLR